MKWTEQDILDKGLQINAPKKIIEKPIKGQIFRIDIKPLTVNQAWQGKRFKTDKYKDYQSKLLFMLPETIGIIPDKIYLKLTFGVSNIGSDVDNPVKLIQDILSKKYGFNDAKIFCINATKVKTEKGLEFIDFALLDYSEMAP